MFAKQSLGWDKKQLLLVAMPVFSAISKMQNI